MSDIRKDAKQALLELNEMIEISGAVTDDEKRYELVFSYWSSYCVPSLAKIGINHDWCDPDTSYKEDVDALINSLDVVTQTLEELTVR